MGLVIENLQAAELCRRWYCRAVLSDSHSQSTGSSEPPPASLEIRDGDGGSLRAVLAGEIDFANAFSLQARISAACAERSTRALVLDLTGVEFMDSSGLRAVLQLRGELTQAGGGLVLLDPTPQVRGILSLTGLDRQLPIADTQEQALALLAGEGREPGGQARDLG